MKRSVLGLDPSSQVVGYGLLHGLEPDGLVDCGLLKPSLASSVLDDLPMWLRAHLSVTELNHHRRIVSLVQEVRRLVEELVPWRIIVEIPSGLFGTGAKHGARGGLTTYGYAAGCVFQACEVIARGRVVPVTERQWTEGRGNKAKRQREVTVVYGRRYNADGDSGGDAADGIGIARWWLQCACVHA